MTKDLVRRGHRLPPIKTPSGSTSPVSIVSVGCYRRTRFFGGRHPLGVVPRLSKDLVGPDSQRTRVATVVRATCRDGFREDKEFTGDRSRTSPGRSKGSVRGVSSLFHVEGRPEESQGDGVNTQGLQCRRETSSSSHRSRSSRLGWESGSWRGEF